MTSQSPGTYRGGAVRGGMTTVGAIPAYRSVPEGEGPWPGMVLVHEIFGLDDSMRRHADRVAAMGYLVVAPDLFSRGGRASCLKATFTALRRGGGPAFDDLDASRADLLADPRCSGSVGVIGFCMGGAFALVVAGQGGWGAASTNYGMLPSDPSALDGACPVVATYGRRDHTLPGAAAKVERALRARGIAHDVKEYPNAGHAFLNEVNNAPWYLAPVTHLVMNGGPEPVSAADAWARIESFLAQHLTP
ncbi:MAG: dienelactone hydrolase family protein [Ornithinibacter sp.]